MGCTGTRLRSTDNDLTSTNRSASGTRRRPRLTVRPRRTDAQSHRESAPPSAFSGGGAPLVRRRGVSAIAGRGRRSSVGCRQAGGRGGPGPRRRRRPCSPRAGCGRRFGEHVEQLEDRRTRAPRPQVDRHRDQSDVDTVLLSIAPLRQRPDWSRRSAALTTAPWRRAAGSGRACTATRRGPTIRPTHQRPPVEPAGHQAEEHRRQDLQNDDRCRSAGTRSRSAGRAR